MKIFTMIGNLGTTLPYAAPMGAVAGQGTGMHGMADCALRTGQVARLAWHDNVADRTRVLTAATTAFVPAIAVPSELKPQIDVPPPPPERSP